MEEVTSEIQNLNNPKFGIHLVSNTVWSQTGYGRLAAMLLPRMQARGHGVSMTGYFGLQGHTLQMNGMNIHPVGYHAYGQDVARGNTILNGAKICMTNVDLWVCEPQMIMPVLWVPWFPIDSESISPLIRAKLPAPFMRLVMSRHGADMVEKAGFPCTFAPGMIDTKVYTPVDRSAALAEMNSHIQFKAPADKFLVSMVQMNKGNPSRKAFCQQMQGFKAFHDKHPDSVLYMHTIKSEGGEQGGVNLPAFCDYLGLKVNVDVLFPDALAIINGYPDVYLNAVYNASDVLLSVTQGEGIGMPIIEAQAAGCPVIIGDWTSMSEVFFSGWKVDKSESQETWTILGAMQHSPNWQAIADRLEQAYEKKGYEKLRRDARKGALAYDADTIFQNHWVPILDELERRIDEVEHDVIEKNGEKCATA